GIGVGEADALPVAVPAVQLLGLPGEQGDPGGDAGGRRGVGPREEVAAAREVVEVRGVDGVVADDAQRVGPHLVDAHQHDVGTVRRGGHRGVRATSALLAGPRAGPRRDAAVLRLLLGLLLRLPGAALGLGAGAAGALLLLRAQRLRADPPAVRLVGDVRV